jgi:C4-dicarboxylate transporter, DctQ subunit
VNSFAAKIAKLFDQLEDGLLVLCMAILLFLSIGQIALRNTLSLTLPWADPFIRHLVLWIGLLGALGATRHDKHVKIDALQRLLPPKIKASTTVITHLFSTAICALLAHHAWRFVADERAYSTLAFAGIAAWKVQLVFPIVFAALSLRYGRYTATSLTALRKSFKSRQALI